jgi:hypothetical protein
VSGSLVPWARRGVLLLNTFLTVRRGEPASHARYGWALLTGAVVQTVNAKPGPVVFLLWGARAQALAANVDEQRHLVIKSSHPSPLSARRGFNGSGPFTTAPREAPGKRERTSRGAACVPPPAGDFRQGPDASSPVQPAASRQCSPPPIRALDARSVRFVRASPDRPRRPVSTYGRMRGFQGRGTTSSPPV